MKLKELSGKERNSAAKSDSDAFLKRIRRRIFNMGIAVIAAALILGIVGVLLLNRINADNHVQESVINIEKSQISLNTLANRLSGNPSSALFEDMVEVLDSMSDRLKDAERSADSSMWEDLSSLGGLITEMSDSFTEIKHLVKKRGYSEDTGLYAQYVARDEELYSLLENELNYTLNIENIINIDGSNPEPLVSGDVKGFLYDSMNNIDSSFKTYSYMVLKGAADNSQLEGIFKAFEYIMNDVSRGMEANESRSAAYEILQYKNRLMREMVDIDGQLAELFGKTSDLSSRISWTSESIRSEAGKKSAAFAATAVPIMIIAMFIVIIAELVNMLILSRSISKSILIFNELKVAEAANDAKSNLLSNVSHEIRTPINAVLGINEIIMRESEDEKIRDYSMDINVAGKTLLSIVNDLLDFSRLDAGKIEIIEVEYDISSCIMDLVNMITVKAENKHLHFEVNVDHGIPQILRGDEIRIKQCILNILTNAVKYTEAGTVTMNIGFEKADEENIYLRVKVADTGIGIKPEDIDKLFKPFERIEEQRNRTIEGTGLGMSIVTRLLEMMGSRLEVKSVYGEGSDFSFTLKQKVVSWEPIGDYLESYRHMKKNAEQYHERFHAPDAKVLVVDDTSMNLTVVKGLVKPLGLIVDTAASGAETLDMVCKTKYDIILLDHMMPEMDGIETLNRMNETEGNLNKGVPCIALTANAISGAREMYLEAGFDDYLSKPIDVIKFEKMLLDYLPKEKIITESDEAFAETSADIVNGRREKIEMLKATGGIDYEKGVAACSSPDILLDAVGDFVLSLESKPDDIENFWKEGDIKNYTILVHAVKSSARLIGAEELSLRAEYLEKCGDENNKHEIDEKTPEFLELYRSYGEKLRAFADDSDNEAKEEISTEQLQEAYTSIAEFVEGFDFESAQSIIDMLGEYRIPDDHIEFFKKVSSLVRTVNRDELLVMLMR